MVRFIYTDECEEGAMEAMADHLLAAATKYQLGRLQVMSELHLVRTLTVTDYSEQWLFDCTLTALRCRWRMRRRGCFWLRRTVRIN